MSGIVAIAGRFVERLAGLIATPWAATIGIIFLLQWLFDVIPAAGAPANVAVQRRSGRCVRVGHAAVDQTPVVHSASVLTHTDQHNYGWSVATATDAGAQHTSSGRPGNPAPRRQDLGAMPATASREYDEVDGGAAIAFERKLGDRLFHDPAAVAAARRTVERLFEVMRLLHVEFHPGTTPRRTERIFFSDKLTNPGQVGRGVVTLPELLREGNLRMVMTALLNAAHDSKDPMTLEMTIEELLKRPAWEEVADDAGLDVPRLRALKQLVDAGHGVFAVPALGSHSSDARDAVTECIASQSARWRRSPADREAYRWTAREFADRGIALHPLEVAAQRRAESAQPVPGGTQIVGTVPEQAGSSRSRDVFDVPPAAQECLQRISSGAQGAKSAGASKPVDAAEVPLHWASGRALFGIDTEAPWFRAVAIERGFPVTTGISGCAARLHSVFIWIRPEGVSEHEFTRALIGWILPSDHHSLYEIIRGIQVASPHLFHAPGDGFSHVRDLYCRAPWVSSHRERERVDAAAAPGAGVSGRQLRFGLRGHRWAGRSSWPAPSLICGCGGGGQAHRRLSE